MNNANKVEALRKAQIEVVLATKSPGFWFRVKRKLFPEQINAWTILKSLPIAIFAMLSITKRVVIAHYKKFCFKNSIRAMNAESDTHTVIIALLITGGIGDFIVHRRAMRDLLLICPILRFDIYTTSPGGAAFVFKDMSPQMRKIFHWDLFDIDMDHYDTAMRLHHTCEFISECTSIERLHKKSPLLAQCYRENSVRLQGFYDFLACHPFLDNKIAELAVERGLNRSTLLQYFLGIPYQGHGLDLSSDVDLSVFSLEPQRYITIHNGWDVNYHIKADAATKNYPDRHWAQVVALLKEQLPGYKIVHLGSRTSRPISGVDVNLIDKTTLSECAGILKHAALHIDSESGLVHIATSLSVKCVVLFGPTSAKYFSYDENINIVPEVCNNCWWLTSDWMARCPRGLKTPECLDSISPKIVVDAALAYLQAVGADSRPHPHPPG